MKNFNFCPHCSSQNFNIANQHRFSCEDCGFIYYHNVASAVAVIIKKENQLLFLKRNCNPKKGMLDLPGGFTDPKETAEETCVRELKEELNLDFNPQNFTYFTSFPNQYKYGKVTYHTADLIFITTLPEKAKIKLEKKEIQAFQWVEKSNIELEKIAFISLRNALKKYLES